MALPLNSTQHVQRGMIPFRPSLAARFQLSAGGACDAWPWRLRASRGMQTLRLEWNLLSGTIPASFSMLPDLVSMAVSPGNYQLCGGLPERAHFSLCRQLGSFCQLHSQLGSTCQQASAVARLALPLSSANSNRLLVS